MGSSEIHFNIKNNCGRRMSLANSDFEDGGEWKASPPTTIEAGTIGSFEGHNSDGKTKGYVSYTLGDNVTVFTINFDIPHSGDNTGSGTLASNPGNPNNYIVVETDSTYNVDNPISFPEHGMPTVYWVVSDA